MKKHQRRTTCRHLFLCGWITSEPTWPLAAEQGHRAADALVAAPPRRQLAVGFSWFSRALRAEGGTAAGVCTWDAGQQCGDMAWPATRSASRSQSEPGPGGVGHGEGMKEGTPAHEAFCSAAQNGCGHLQSLTDFNADFDIVLLSAGETATSWVINHVPGKMNWAVLSSPFPSYFSCPDSSIADHLLTEP